MRKMRIKAQNKFIFVTVININTICLINVITMSEMGRRATMSDFLTIPKYERTQNNEKITKNQKHYGERKRIKP